MILAVELRHALLTISPMSRLILKLLDAQISGLDPSDVFNARILKMQWELLVVAARRLLLLIINRL